jgi:hypothetical protein
LYFNTSSTEVAWIVIALSYAFFIHNNRLAFAGRSRFLNLAFGVLFSLGIGITTIAVVQSPCRILVRVVQIGQITLQIVQNTKTQKDSYQSPCFDCCSLYIHNLRFYFILTLIPA